MIPRSFGDVDISDEWVPSVQLEWFFNENVSAELLCCIARHEVGAVDTALGPVDLGSFRLQATHLSDYLSASHLMAPFGRLGALARGLPKAMVMVGGRPFLEYIIDSFTERGFTQFVLLVGHHSDVIESHFRSGQGDRRI